MKFLELEELVANTVADRYEMTSTIPLVKHRVQIQRQFLRDIGSSYTNMSGDPDYSGERAGEAYSLRWHCHRADDAVIVLSRNDFLLESGPLWMDIGSGTGALHSALVYLSTFRAVEPIELQLVEPCGSMRLMSRRIARKLFDEGELEIETCPITCSFNEAITLQEILSCQVTRRVDLLVFHHTFPLMNEQELVLTEARLGFLHKEVLKPGGRILMIYPSKPEEKAHQAQRLVEFLISRGAVEETLKLPGRGHLRNAIGRKRNTSSIRVMKSLNSEARRLKEIDPFPLDDDGALPWYGFYANAKCVRKRD